MTTLVVHEDWGDVKNQKIEEERDASIGMEDAVVSDDSESRKDSVVEDVPQINDDEEVQQDEPIVPEEHEKSTFFSNDSDQVNSMRANKANPPKVCV